MSREFNLRKTGMSKMTEMKKGFIEYELRRLGSWLWKGKFFFLIYFILYVVLFRVFWYFMDYHIASINSMLWSFTILISLDILKDDYKRWREDKNGR